MTSEKRRFFFTLGFTAFAAFHRRRRRAPVSLSFLLWSNPCARRLTFLSTRYVDPEKKSSIPPPLRIRVYRRPILAPLNPASLCPIPIGPPRLSAGAAPLHLFPHGGSVPRSLPLEGMASRVSSAATRSVASGRHKPLVPPRFPV